MKTEHTKEFNVEHAKQGAPYCQRNGLAARIGIWDVSSKFYPLSGVRSTSKEEIVCSWTEEGGSTTQGKSCCDLVMLPLGYCEGKPVFVDDELVDHMENERFKATEGMNSFGSCKWPRTAPVMPTFFATETSNDLFQDVVYKHRRTIEAYYKQLDEYEAGMK
jgi:hypothetical protein